MAGLTDTALRYRPVPNSDTLFWFGIGLMHWSSVWTYGDSGMGISLIVSPVPTRSMLSHLLPSSQKDFYNRKKLAPVWPENDNHEQDTSKKLREHEVAPSSHIMGLQGCSFGQRQLVASLVIHTSIPSQDSGSSHFES